MTAPRFLTAKEAKDAKWFSRRHETSEANQQARERYEETRGRKARQRRAAERSA